MKKGKTPKNVPLTMAFYHQDGLIAAHQQATKFAGKDGRLATMPDIVAMRIKEKPGELPWETFFTTLTAEYYGISRSGKRILIVAHGTGPMSTLEGIKKAYSWHYKDKKRGRKGGRISQQEFWDLEAGKYGKVDIVDLEDYCKRYQYPFMETLRLSQAMSDPVLLARLGPEAETYLQIHAQAAREWCRERAGIKQPYLSRDMEKLGYIGPIQYFQDGADDSDPVLVTLEDAGGCRYFHGHHQNGGFRELEEGMAIAHLISTGCLVNLMQGGGGASLSNSISCHEWWNGVRLVGIKPNNGTVSSLHRGPNTHNLLRKHWKKLFTPTEQPTEIGFVGLMQIKEKWFTQYPKSGSGMDTNEPEFLVTKIKSIGEPVLSRTTIIGYHGFFKFDLAEVKAIAPPKANAYFFTTDPQNEWNNGSPTHQTCMVQFYRITADTTQRLRQTDDLARDYDTLMSLIEQDSA